MLNHVPDELSEREREILRLVATGASNKEIAQQLFISPNTVKVHLRNIFAKIGSASRTEAAMYAVRIGLVEGQLRQEADEQEAQTIDPAQSFPRPAVIVPDAIVEKPRPAPRMNWIVISGVIIITLTLAALGIGLLGNGSLVANLTPPPPPTSTPIQQWFLLTDLPTPRTGLATVGYEGKIYAIAGETVEGVTGVVERFDTQTNDWEALNPKPLQVADVTAAVIGGKIYIPGGRLASGQPSAHMAIFDPVQNTWTEGTYLPHPNSAYAMVAFEGRLYIFGGWDGQKYLDTVLIYAPDRDTWIEGPTMPEARAFASAVVTGNKIYVLGGTDGHQPLASIDIYQPDLDEQSWSQGTPLPEGRYSMGVANLADIIHVFGGKGNEPTFTGLAYFAQQNDWRQIETPLQESCSSLGIATLGTRLYILGGKTAEGLKCQTWSYQAIFIITLPIVR